MNKTLLIIIGLVVLVAVAGGSFFAGTVYGKQQATATQAANFGSGQRGFINNGDGAADGSAADVPFRRPGGTDGGAFGQGGGTFGQIEQIEGDTLVVSTQDGGQKRFVVTDTTLIEKNASVSITDLENGEMVIIAGSENDDGSITARSVQVAPAGRFGGGQPGVPGNAQQ